MAEGSAAVCAHALAKVNTAEAVTSTGRRSLCSFLVMTLVVWGSEKRTRRRGVTRSRRGGSKTRGDTGADCGGEFYPLRNAEEAREARNATTL